MLGDYSIIHYPDPRLKKISLPVESYNDALKALALRMVELMQLGRGVGLAAPQVGENIRLFIINPTGNPQDLRFYVNPTLLDGQGDEEGEEGCLSVPDIHIKIVRAKKLRIQAFDLEGKPFEEIAEGYVPRIWQHEFDHLNGILLVDRMGTVAKLANRKKLLELREVYQRANPAAPATMPAKRRTSRKK